MTKRSRAKDDDELLRQAFFVAFKRVGEALYKKNKKCVCYIAAETSTDKCALHALLGIDYSELTAALVAAKFATKQENGKCILSTKKLLAECGKRALGRAVAIIQVSVSGVYHQCLRLGIKELEPHDSKENCILLHQEASATDASIVSNLKARMAAMQTRATMASDLQTNPSLGLLGQQQDNGPNTQSLSAMKSPAAKKRDLKATPLQRKSSGSSTDIKSPPPKTLHRRRVVASRSDPASRNLTYSLQMKSPPPKRSHISRVASLTNDEELGNTNSKSTAACISDVEDHSPHNSSTANTIVNTLDDFRKQIASNQPSKELIGLFNQFVKKNSDKDGFFALKSKNGTSVMHATIPRQRRGDVWTIKTTRKRAQLIGIILDTMHKDAAIQKEILGKAAKDRSLKVLTSEQAELSVPQISATMALLKISGKKVGKLGRCLKVMLPESGAVVPKRLMPKLRKFEIDNAVKGKTSIVSLQVAKDGEMKNCVYWTLGFNSLAVIERLISSAVIAGRYMKSSDISKHDRKCVLCLGADKGGTTTPFLVRVVNREGGNSKDASQPLALYEDGSESYSNLEKTIYKEGSEIEQMINALMNDHLQHTTFAFYQSANGKTDARTILFKLALPDKKPFEDGIKLVYDANLNCHSEGVHYSHDQTVQFRPGFFTLAHSPQPDVQFRLTFGFIYELSSVSGYVDVIGVTMVYDHRIVLSTTKFYTSIRQVKLAANCFLSFSEHILSFPSHDTKMGLTLSGQASASSLCPCLVCTAEKANFNTPPAYMSDAFAQECQCQDAPLREGPQHGNDASYQRYKQQTNDGSVQMSAAEERNIKLDAYSVVQKPLCSFRPMKDPCAPMHAPKNLLKHFFGDTRAELDEIDMDSTFTTFTDEANTAAALFIESTSQEYKNQQSTLKSNRSTLNRLMIRKRKETDVAQVAELQQEINDKVVLQNTLSDVSGHQELSYKRNGAQKLRDAITQFKKSQKPKGVGVFIFNKAIELCGRVTFRAEYSGTDLSLADYIKAVESYNDIANIVSDAFPVDSSEKVKVDALLARTRCLANAILPVVKTLKSQKKVEAARLEQFEKDCTKLMKEWIKCFPNHKVFVSLHHMLHHHPHFMGNHGMFGILSEEGFEATHPWINELQQLTKSVLNNQQRLDVMMRRFQITLNNEVQELLSGQAPRHGSRGPYARGQRQLQTENIDEVDNVEDTQGAPDGYFWLDKTTLMKNEWRMVYAYCKEGEVPGNWKKAIEDRDDLTLQDKTKAGYLKS